jgi:hypothetical protein
MGFSSQWGWSWGDFSANMLGSSALVAQELAWNDQRIKLKFSFHHRSYSDPSLNQRSDELFGKNETSRFIKDYNGKLTGPALISDPSFQKLNGRPGYPCPLVMALMACSAELKISVKTKMGISSSTGLI